MSPWPDDETLPRLAIVEGRLELPGVRFDEVAAPMFSGVTSEPSSSSYSMLLSSERTENYCKNRDRLHKATLLRDCSMARNCLIFAFNLAEGNGAKSGSMSFTGFPVSGASSQSFSRRTFSSDLS